MKIPKRREFLTMIAGLGAASPFAIDLVKAQQPPAANPVRQEWLDLRKEPILEPSLPIIDPHHHLWVRGAWRYLIDELLVNTVSGPNIVATVFVQARSMYRTGGPVEMRPVGETEVVNGVAAMCASGYCGKTGVAAEIIGHADLTLGRRAEPILIALMHAGGDRFCGIRHITAWDADASLNNPAYPAGRGCWECSSKSAGWARRSTESG
jgi:L-fuconolactonase